MKTNFWLALMLYTKQNYDLYLTFFLVICKEGLFEIQKYKNKTIRK